MRLGICTIVCFLLIGCSIDLNQEPYHDFDLLGNVILAYFPCSDHEFEHVVSTRICNISHSLDFNLIDQFGQPLDSTCDFSLKFGMDPLGIALKDTCYESFVFADVDHKDILGKQQTEGNPRIYLLISGACFSHKDSVLVKVERKVLKNYSVIGVVYFKDSLGKWNKGEEVYHAAY
ncbi:MAG: hypothetical protein IPJ06_17075 [Saprospiraceae bacterium]|nr:hypothetical protein [Saprospiraceae bacterium]